MKNDQSSMTIVLIQSSEEIKSNERINMMTMDLGDLGCVQSIAFMWSLVQDLTRPSNMPKLSENQRWLLNGMLEAGQSVSETARTLNVARSVVRKWRDRRQQPGGSLKDFERSGRPRVTSANQDASILNKVEAKRTMTAREIRRRLHRRRGQRPGQICYQTIRNRIRAYGMRSRKLRKRPGLLPRHRRDRKLLQGDIDGGVNAAGPTSCLPMNVVYVYAG
ncbi:uncharacterized protein [Amphiura filiformis]|uniref:uncharacterized protein n=1 Tax=Amphiura filiformis TaxID=82378 RepID=UPI003B223B80